MNGKAPSLPYFDRKGRQVLPSPNKNVKNFTQLSLGDGDTNFYAHQKLKEDFRAPENVETGLTPAGAQPPLPEGERNVGEILTESPDLKKYSPYDEIVRDRPLYAKDINLKHLGSGIERGKRLQANGGYIMFSPGVVSPPRSPEEE